MALVPPAQAVTGATHMPLSPKRMAIWPAAMLAMVMGTKKGLTRSKPFCSPLACSSSILGRPPMPADTMVAKRVASVFSISMPASSIASMAAAMANWVKRAILRLSRLSTRTAGSKSLTSAASLVLLLLVS